jgi:hypothetical protein
VNSLHLLQEIVPTILKCRNFRGNESEREGAPLVCGADQNESACTTKMDGIQIITKEDRKARNYRNVVGMIPTTFTSGIGRSHYVFHLELRALWKYLT